MTLSQIETLSETEPGFGVDVPPDPRPTGSRRGSVSRNGMIWRRLKATPRFWLGGSVLAFLILFAFVGPLLSPYQITDQDPLYFNYPPTAVHWFGTDTLGHDVRPIGPSPGSSTSCWCCRPFSS
jgi:hypothetical protein